VRKQRKILGGYFILPHPVDSVCGVCVWLCVYKVLERGDIAPWWPQWMTHLYRWPGLQSSTLNTVSAINSPTHSHRYVCQMAIIAHAVGECILRRGVATRSSQMTCSYCFMTVCMVAVCQRAIKSTFDVDVDFRQRVMLWIDWAGWWRCGCWWPSSPGKSCHGTGQLLQTQTAAPLHHQHHLYQWRHWCEWRVRTGSRCEWTCYNEDSLHQHTNDLSRNTRQSESSFYHLIPPFMYTLTVVLHC